MLNDFLDQGRFRSILCLNGDLPAADFFARPLPIIAADGAANQLHQMGVSPNLVIGDLDSVKDTSKCHYPHLACPNQDSSDFEKCLLYLQKNHLLPAIITGLNGGALDHILNNVNVFLRTDCLLYAPPLMGFVLKPGEKQLALPFNTKISLLGFPDATVSTLGLKWELEHNRLCFPGINSCFNRTCAPTLELRVSMGSLLVLVYLEDIYDAGRHP